jgi:hypothetical protein
MSDECATPPAEPIPSLPNNADYRRLARQIRDLAGRNRLPVARGELLRLATNYSRTSSAVPRRPIEKPWRT